MFSVFLLSYRNTRESWEAHVPTAFLVLPIKLLLTFIGVWVLSDFRGWWPSCPKNLHNAWMHDCWNQDANAFKLSEKQKLSQSSHLMKLLYLVALNFRESLISRILDFSSFAGINFCKFGFQTLLLGIVFCRFHVQYLKVTKTEAIWPRARCWCTNQN